MAKKCPCEIYAQSCCACVSMHCDECHGHSKFVQGRFCSNCGRPLKAELTRLYVPKSEVAREIFEEMDNILHKFVYPSLTAIGNIKCIEADGLHLNVRDYNELKKKYTEENDDT